MNKPSKDGASHRVIRGQTMGPEQIDDADSTRVPTGTCEFCWVTEATSWIRFRGQSKQAGVTYPQRLAACPSCVDMIHSRDIDALSAIIASGDMWPEDIDPVAFLDAADQ